MPASGQSMPLGNASYCRFPTGEQEGKEGKGLDLVPDSSECTVFSLLHQSRYNNCSDRVACAALQSCAVPAMLIAPASSLSCVGTYLQLKRNGIHCSKCEMVLTTHREREFKCPKLY